tara:strand:+ start:41 stop:310 length:270 start_codon:yes stop_codon:yes gene_type:complete
MKKNRNKKNRLERIRQGKAKRAARKNELSKEEVAQIAYVIENMPEGEDTVWEWTNMSKRKKAKAQQLYMTMLQAKKIALEQQKETEDND